MTKSEFEITEKERDKINDRIERIKDKLTDLRKTGKDPLTQNLELREAKNHLQIVYEAPSKEKLDNVKRLLKNIEQELKIEEETNELNLIKEYNRKEGEE